MKKASWFSWVMLAFAIFGAMVLLFWGRLIKAAWYAMGSDPTSTAQKAALDKGIAEVEKLEAAKTPAK